MMLLLCWVHLKEIAIKRLNTIWNHLDANKTMANLYTEFMNKYLSLNHMEPVMPVDNCDTCYYIPHHIVYHPKKTSTRLRVVFDASCKSSSGYPLNSILLNGGTIQEDLFSIVSRFRKHRFAFSADIKQIYRQILKHLSQRNLQRTVWKPSRDAPVQVYRLRTVTYRTTSAPFLAMRTLKALAADEQDHFPRAAGVTSTNFYMDDILTGGNTLEEAKELQSELVQMLRRRGMELHKWVSNHPDLLHDISTKEYSFESQESVVKTLGMLWKPKDDHLIFKTAVNNQNSFTKRQVLSEIAKLFDPLGLIRPVVTRAKIFMQRLWLLKLDWNEELPPKEL
ncbi:uncharacterized protein LOC118204004 [Stegodyphus dumicola]|uniref:uncharacterized protein LOC118204004 n=1 Tax=Stegodyphus dumicola TaxID=202533 RepID=UPI0015B1119C|nr:uncharacterized protein LOC118204004 [Stegodyphus dumicola]